MILCYRNNGTIIQDGNSDQSDDWNRKVRRPIRVILVRMIKDTGDEEEEQQLFRARDAVNHKVLHSLEDLPGCHNGGDDGG